MTKEEMEQQQSEYWHRFFTVPNIFTLLRIASSIGLVACLAVNGLAPLTIFGLTSNIWLPTWSIVTAATDFVDGLLARTLHQQSKWGQALDPVADKVLNWGIAITLIASGVMPLWVLAIGARDFAMGVYTAKKKLKNGQEQEKKEESKKVESKSSNHKQTFKEKYHTFVKGEAPNPTFPAKLKMALQSAGGIATLAFGFGSLSPIFLGLIMTASALAMCIPEIIPLPEPLKKIDQLLRMALVVGVGVASGGAAAIAPVMMASAISMVIPEIIVVRRKQKEIQSTNISSEEQVDNKVIEVPEVEEKEKVKVNAKTYDNKSKIDNKPNIDYTEIDRYIEQQMLLEKTIEEEKGYQKRKR